MIGIALTYATVDSITNNTVDGWLRGINAWNSTCSPVKDNILSRNTIGIKKEGSGSLGLSYNGYWKCDTNVAGMKPGSDNRYLDDSDNPYVGVDEFYLDQSCDFVDHGSWGSILAGLNNHTTNHGIGRDEDMVDMGYHYPFLLKPYLQNVKTDRITVMWHTKEDGTAR